MKDIMEGCNAWKRKGDRFEHWALGTGALGCCEERFGSNGSEKGERQ